MKTRNLLITVMAILCLSQTACQRHIPVFPENTDGTSDTAPTETLPIISETMPTLSDKETNTMNRQNPYYTELLKRVEDRTTPITWLFIGDSITANDGNSADDFSNYPEIFQKYLINGLLRPADTVINTAVSGWRIANCNYDVSVKPYAPDVVFLNIGTNDSFASDADAAAFREKVEAFLDKVKAGGAIPVVIASGSFSDNWVDEKQKSNFLQRYFAAIEGAAQSRETLFVDLFHAYEADRAHASLHYFCSDTVHPSRAGFLFIAQTLIRQLGIANESSPILAQDPSEMYLAEPLLDRLSITLDLSRYTTKSSDFSAICRIFPRGFVMAGGPSAIGRSDCFITRRTLAQHLMSNLKDGKTSLLHGSLTTIQAELERLDTNKPLLLYPEAYAVTGEPLVGEDPQAELTALVTETKNKGVSLLLITPPVVSETSPRSQANERLAEAMRTVAKAQDVTLIDLNAYFADIGKENPTYLAKLFDEKEVLGYAGAAEAAMLIAESLGMDSSLFSTKSFKELYYPQIWGAQGAGHYYYYYQAKADHTLQELEFIPYDSPFTTKGTFSLSFKNVNLNVGQYVLNVLPQYNVVKAFKAPVGGTVTVTVQMKSHSSDDQLFLVVTNDGDIVTINGKDKTVITTNHGANKTVTFQTELKADSLLSFVFTAATAQRGYVLLNVTYL